MLKAYLVEVIIWHGSLVPMVESTTELVAGMRVCAAKNGINIHEYK
jgi:hypothetical protein